MTDIEQTFETDTQPIAVFDIDGVLFNTPDDAVASANARNGTSYSVEDIFNHNAEHDKSKFVIDGVDQFHSYQLDTSQYRKVEDAKEALQALVDNGVKVIALASRNYDMFHETTKVAIAEHFGDLVSEVYFTTEPGSEEHKEKGEIIRELGGQVHVDDAVKYCLSAEAQDIPGILLARDYNRTDHVYPPEKTAQNMREAASMMLRQLGLESS